MKNTLFVSSIFIILLYGCSNNQNSDYNIELSGAGVTFPQSFYDIVIANYSKETGNRIIYTSSGGMRVFHDKVVDFVVTDVFLTDKEIAECGSEVLHIPCSLGAVVLAFNLPGIKELNLNPEIIANIYLRKTTRWNDPSIAAINPGVNLPNLLITSVFRSEGSGATYLFSNYLSRNYPQWKETIGMGTSLKLYEGLSIKGNSAVAGTVSDISGSIAYVSLEQASLLNLSTAAIQNSAGNYVKANKKSLRYITETEFPDDMRITLTDPITIEDAYPIPSLSWVLVYKNQSHNHRGFEKYKSLKTFLNYIVSPKAQAVAGKLAYSPLPDTVIEKAHKLIDSIRWE